MILVSNLVPHIWNLQSSAGSQTLRILNARLARSTIVKATLEKDNRRMRVIALQRRNARKHGEMTNYQARLYMRTSTSIPDMTPQCSINKSMTMKGIIAARCLFGCLLSPQIIGTSARIVSERAGPLLKNITSTVPQLLPLQSSRPD